MAKNPYKGTGLTPPDKITDEELLRIAAAAPGYIGAYNTARGSEGQAARATAAGINNPFDRKTPWSGGSPFGAKDPRTATPGVKNIDPLSGSGRYGYDDPYAKIMNTLGSETGVRILAEAAGIDYDQYLHDKGTGAGSIRDKKVDDVFDAAIKVFGNDPVKAQTAVESWAQQNPDRLREIYAIESADAVIDRNKSNFIHSVVAPTVLGVVAGPAGPIAGTIAGAAQGGIRTGGDLMGIAQGALAGYGGTKLFGSTKNALGHLSGLGQSGAGAGGVTFTPSDFQGAINALPGPVGTTASGQLPAIGGIVPATTALGSNIAVPTRGNPIPGASSGITTPGTSGGLTTAQGAGTAPVSGAGMTLAGSGGAPIGASPLAVAGGAPPLPGVNALPSGNIPGTNQNVGRLGKAEVQEGPTRAPVEPSGDNWLSRLADYGSNLISQGAPPGGPANIIDSPAGATGLPVGFTGGPQAGSTVSPGGFPMLSDFQQSLGGKGKGKGATPGNILNILAMLAPREVFV